MERTPDTPTDLIVTESQGPPPSAAIVELRTQMLSCPAEKLPVALAEYSERRRIVHDWLRAQLRPGVHYGFPPGTQPASREAADGSKEYRVWNKKKNAWDWYSERQWTPKPSLYKAGADFVVDLFGLREEYEPDMAAWEQLGKLPSTYVFRCRLYSRASDKLVGEGYGARKANGPGDLNAAIKMAQKSAKVAAVLDAFSLADLFTQDLEDLIPDAHAQPTPAANAPKVKPRAERQESAGEVSEADLKTFWTRWKSWRQRIGAQHSQAAAYEWVGKQFGGKVDFNIFAATEWDGASFEQCKQQLAEEENATG